MKRFFKRTFVSSKPDYTEFLQIRSFMQVGTKAFIKADKANLLIPLHNT